MEELTELTMEIQSPIEEDNKTENRNPAGFCTVEEEDGIGIDETEIWLENDGVDLLDVNDPCMFYSDFPPLPGFPCMSSSSSSSSTPAPAKTVAVSSSSSSASSSSAALKSGAGEEFEGKNHDHHYNGVPASLSSTASMEFPPQLEGDGSMDCMDMMETFGYLDLLETEEFFNPAYIFDNQAPMEDIFENNKKEFGESGENPEQGKKQATQIQGDGDYSNEMAKVFLEWLRKNKDTVSAEELRNVKIKKATVEFAAGKLGGGKEGNKELLKLILDWVKTNQIQKKRLKDASPFQVSNQLPLDTSTPNPNPNPDTNLNFGSAMPESNPNQNQNPVCYGQPPWVSNTQAAVNTVPLQTYPSQAMFVPNTNNYLYPQAQSEYHTIEQTQSWPPSQFMAAPAPAPYAPFADSNLYQAPSPHAQAFPGYGGQYPYQYGLGDPLVRLRTSATKEARKKRMARQRRSLTHHRHHHHHHNNQRHHQNLTLDQHAMLNAADNCTTPQPQSGSWVFWPTIGGGTPVQSQAVPAIQSEPPMVQPADRQAPQAAQNNRDRRQGWKPENNLRFLLQKVLKQSDVGSLGRIVLPKKEAETHLPELEVRDGIAIAMEDIGTSQVWNMRYRYWPNNKSRMYLLENTGDFVKANGLQEGDFIVIYSDIKCGKYLIRGVKVRQQGQKPENKRAGKSQKNQHSSSPARANASSSSPTEHKQTGN
ncbi:hypothetical protein UlMin_031803 [Ulmus minor]